MNQLCEGKYFKDYKNGFESENIEFRKTSG